jgi:hypothetical protein
VVIAQLPEPLIRSNVIMPVKGKFEQSEFFPKAIPLLQDLFKPRQNRIVRLLG